MKVSPRRPLILKRRKLPFHRDEADGPRRDCPPAAGPPAVSAQPFPDGIRVVDHPSLSDTQVVVIPKTADLQSVIGALTAKGKERGAQGPNKFILLSGSGGIEPGDHALIGSTPDTPSGTLAAKLEPAPAAEDATESKPLPIKNQVKLEAERWPLNESLTNMQWLGKMTPCSDSSALRSSGKEPPADGAQHQEPGPSEEAPDSKGPQSERPPYSYMAMIQFAINSSVTRKLTLKEIYTWIEEHFPYFRTVAKPGWKNSIRHNLSLHDMFVRETTCDGKVSYWTIKPEVNRCLTLDQVFKPVTEPAPPSYLQTMQVCFQQQKRVIADVRKVTAGTSERKIKPILPRADSYLVPIQLPLTPSLFLPSSTALSLPPPQQVSNPSSGVGGKRVRIAPMVPPSDSRSADRCTPTTKVKEECVCVPVTSEPCIRKRKEASRSRRKQRLFPPSAEEPVLFFPDSTFFDSGLASDISTTHEQEPEAQAECDTFKTPIKSSHPASSTPSKVAEPWRVTPLGKDGHAVLDFSPIRTPQHCSLSFSSTPFKELPLFSSPRELLTSCPREAGSSPSVAAVNRSFTEGLVLDTLNDSLSKILVDISFSGLEDEDLGIGNISWSQFIPELK